LAYDTEGLAKLIFLKRERRTESSPLLFLKVGVLHDNLCILIG
jgi:hypothetical protein